MALDPARAAIRLAVRRELADREGPVLVACSGGADSLALLAATVFEGRKAGVRVVGAVVDHGLQDGSAEHTERVVGQMAALGVDETASIRVRVDVAAGGVEAGAREARYAALGELAQHFGAPTVLLGHTLDDQAETVLLGLARGSGGRSIAGMRRWFAEGRALFVRPLLDITRTQTEAACRADGIDFWSDPHNADPRFLRARVRHDVLPVLERELGPGVAETLARTADQLRRDMEALDGLATMAFQEVATGRGIDVALDVWALEPQPNAVISRALRLAAIEAGALGAELFAVHVDALTAMAVGHQTGKQIQLPGHLTAWFDGEYLRFRRTGS